MELLLERIERTTESTIGRLTADGEFVCFILEDTDRGLTQAMTTAAIAAKKIKGKTAIPAGRYQVIRTLSARFNKVLPLLVNVPGYEGIRIHPGNTSTDTEGCLLPGTGKGFNKVTQSRKAFEALDAKIKAALDHKQVYITIE